MSVTRIDAHRQRAFSARAQATAERRAKRETDAIVAAFLTCLVTVIALYDLVLLTVSLH